MYVNPHKLLEGIHTKLPIQLAHKCTQENTDNLHHDGQENIVIHSIHGASDRCSCTTDDQHRNQHLHHQVEGKSLRLERTTLSCVMTRTTLQFHTRKADRTSKTAAATTQTTKTQWKRKKEIQKTNIWISSTMGSVSISPYTMPRNTVFRICDRISLNSFRPATALQEWRNTEKGYPWPWLSSISRVDGLPCSSHVNIKDESYSRYDRRDEPHDSVLFRRIHIDGTRLRAIRAGAGKWNGRARDRI
jgi:hypothetical protein